MSDEHRQLDERYFKWLYEQVDPLDTRDPSRSHVSLCDAFFNTPFEWVVDRDENRAAHGQELRYEFMNEFELTVPNSWLDLDCSVLEMLIGLARSASFQTGIELHIWFWLMVENIGLDRYTDDVYSASVHSSVNAILNRVMHRRYQASGRGGFFPLRDPKEDQREVELWYQLSAYIIENYNF